MMRRSAGSKGDDGAKGVKRVQSSNPSTNKQSSAKQLQLQSTSALDPADDPPRCKWAGAFTGAASPEYIKYHDEEWGRPVHDDRLLFELLVLEGAQAGLSWRTVLSRREAYRRAFKDFDPCKVAAFGEREVDALMTDGSGVIRHRGKLQSAVKNAKVFLELQRQHGSFTSYLWGFVPNARPIVNAWTSVSQVPAKTAESEALSKALKSAGMSFVGPTIMYAYMQATGLVNDHTTDCHCYHHIIDGYKAAADLVPVSSDDHHAGGGETQSEAASDDTKKHKLQQAAAPRSSRRRRMAKVAEQ